ncbi:neprilysin-1-like [Rhipicephalus microplus]|uniref:neprilysin-1-like n=1 Tax=Rhipicephalus microplus TaxID=6941 RepID=UPI003F6B6C6F
MTYAETVMENGDEMNEKDEVQLETVEGRATDGMRTDTVFTLPLSRVLLPALSLATTETASTCPFQGNGWDTQAFYRTVPLTQPEASTSTYQMALTLEHLVLTTPWETASPGTSTSAPTERLNEVRQLVFRIKDAFFEAVHSSSWLTSSARTRLLEKLEEMEVLVGSPGDRLEPEFVERFYKPLHDVPVNRLFSSWIEGRRLNTHYRWKDQKTMFYDEERVRTFLMGSNTAVITSGQVHRPFIYEYGPPALNYAGMGMTIGHILMRGFDDAHLGGQFWSAKDVKKEYAKRTLCLRRSHRSLAGHGLKSQDTRWQYFSH